MRVGLMAAGFALLTAAQPVRAADLDWALDVGDEVSTTFDPRTERVTWQQQTPSSGTLSFYEGRAHTPELTVAFVCDDGRTRRRLKFHESRARGEVSLRCVRGR